MSRLYRRRRLLPPLHDRCSALWRRVAQRHGDAAGAGEGTLSRPVDAAGLARMRFMRDSETGVGARYSSSPGLFAA